MVSCYETKYITVNKKIDLQDEVRARWKGATKQQVINEFGPPNYEEPDGGDGTILIYNMEHKSTDETLNRYGYIWIYLNSDGICTNLKSDQFYKYDVEQIKQRVYDKEKTTAVLGVTGCLGVIGLALLIAYLATH